MKKLRILVVDDTPSNIEAAKVAAQEFPQHEFVFLYSAIEAFNKIKDFDAVITDLFFPEKPEAEIKAAYDKMLPAYSTESRFYQKIIRGHENLFPPEKFEKNVTIINSGLNTSLTSYNPLETPEFPLALPIIIEAKRQQKRICLVSDIHRHGDADGEIIFLPLMEAYILNEHDVSYDGQGGLTYIGRDRMGNDNKKRPIVWEIAIHCVLAQ